MKMKYALLFLIFCFSCASSSDNAGYGEKSWSDLGSFRYGDDANQFVEITIPDNKENANVIYYIHGYGNKMVDLTFLENYRNDFIIGKLDYRYLTPKRTDLSMDELLADVHNGLSMLKEKIEERGVTADKVIMMGNSIGSTFALLYSYGYSEKSPIPIAFCVSMSAITDFTDAMILKSTERFGKRLILKYMLAAASILTETELTSADITELGFSEKAVSALKRISPVQYVNENIPPTIILHDTNDKIVPFSNAVALNSVLTARNVAHIFIQSVTNSGHELGANIRNKNRVFAPLNARSPVKTPKRYTRQIHPVAEEKLIAAINQYVKNYL